MVITTSSSSLFPCQVLDSGTAWNPRPGPASLALGSPILGARGYGQYEALKKLHYLHLHQNHQITKWFIMVYHGLSMSILDYSEF
jgi:hypothetical protein